MKTLKHSKFSRICIMVLSMIFLNRLHIHAQYLNVDSVGNVGVGTNSPSAKLHVNGGINVGTGNPYAPDTAFYADDNYISFREYGVSEDFLGYKGNTFYFKDAPGGADASQPGVVIGGNLEVNGSAVLGNISEDSTLTRLLVTDSNGDIRYRTLSSTDNWTLTSGNLFRSSGKVGIGVSSIGGADTKLQVWGGDIRIDNDNNLKSSGILNIQADDDNSGDGTIKFHAGTDVRMTMTDAGRLGIGTTNPSHLLDVNGSIQCITLNTTSDQRLKKDLDRISGAISLVEQLDGLTYRFKARDSKFVQRNLPNKKQYGFSAQDVRKVLPDLVHEDEEGFLSVNYIGVIPVLVEALKEQNAEIRALTEKLNEWERRLGSSATPGMVEPNDVELLTPKADLFQNAPNPFTEKTTIRYQLPERARNVQLIVYDLQGNQLKAFKDLPAGQGAVEIFGRSLKAGMYVYSLIADNQVINTKRMILTD